MERGGTWPAWASVKLTVVSSAWKVKRAVFEIIALMRSGIGFAGHFDDDAVDALALDDRLLGAHLVDAVAHHLDRLADNRGRHRGFGFAGQRGDDAVAVFEGDVEVGLPADTGGAADILREVAHLLHGVARLRRIAQRDEDGGAPARRRVDHRLQAGIADMLLVERLADVVFEALHAQLENVGGLDAEEEMRAAAKVEAEIDGLMRQPARHRRAHLFGQRVRQREQERDQNDPENESGLERLEAKHGRVFVRAG